MNLVEHIRNVIASQRLIPEGMPVVAGVSGGADSVALLRALHALGIPLTVAHLNHRLRDSESDADETFVRKLAEELSLPIRVQTVDVKALAETTDQSLEMAARQARHDFFAEFGDAAIALAHHADDQVETFMLRLARGAGPEGLCGMPYAQRIGTILMIRPLLDVPRQEITDWLRINRYAWREDSSNRDEKFLRNRIRHAILPLLERELNPQIRNNILQTMDILREENAWMDAMQDDSDARAARRRRLRKWLFEQGVDQVDFETVNRVLALMDKGAGTKIVDLNRRQRVVIEYGRPRFEMISEADNAPAWHLSTEAGTGWRKDHGKGAGILPAEASFDAAKIGGAPIVVRQPRPGDRMAPWGMDGSRKLQDILTDQKVPKAERSRIPVVECRGEIIWLPGYRIARDWAVPDEQAESIHVGIEQIPSK